MAATDYLFSIANDTLRGDVARGSLEDTLSLWPVLAGAVLAIDTVNDEIKVTTPDELDPVFEVPILHSLIHAHDGVDLLRTLIHTRKLVGPELGIIASPQVVDGFIMPPEMLTSTIERLVFRIAGHCKGTGAGATVQVIEDTDGNEQDKIATPFAIPDTSGAWQPFSVDSDVVLRSGVLPNTYRIEASLGAATSAALRFCSIAPIWV